MNFKLQVEQLQEVIESFANIEKSYYIDSDKLESIIGQNIEAPLVSIQLVSFNENVATLNLWYIDYILDGSDGNQLQIHSDFLSFAEYMKSKDYSINTISGNPLWKGYGGKCAGGNVQITFELQNNKC